MESPKKSSIKSIIASISSPQSTVSFQESSIFNYINSLSPIKPVKGTSVLQVLPGLTSPPLVFTSPRINTHRQSTDLKSSQCRLSSDSELFQQDDTVNIMINSNLTALQDSSVDILKDAQFNANDSMHPEGSVESSMLAEQDHGVSLRSCPKPVVEDEKTRGFLQSNICHNLESNVSGDHIPVQQYDQQVSQVGQSQLSKRRRLQFGEAHEEVIENCPSSLAPLTPAANSGSPESSLVQGVRNSSLPVCKPSGIGLHLNSIVNPKPLIYSVHGGKKSISVNSQDSTQCLSVSSDRKLVENVSVRSEECNETLFSDAKSTKMSEYQNYIDQGSLNSEQAERVDELERSRPKKKRKKSENTGDGCKRCSCKKTKCLKLYCDCFAAGIYCAGPCSCQGCFNRPEFEQTVLETRQQIESRNPLAFAPKIVHHLSQPLISQTVEHGDQVTPLAKHKRGCNCKKSMCLKKYCECYQANVGCSAGCRCEGCQNIYGAKAVSGIHRVMVMEANSEKLNGSSDDKLKVVSLTSRSSLPKIHKPHNLTPQTPSIQCSNNGKDASSTRVLPKRYVPSPESECTFYPPCTTTPTSPKDSSDFNMITEASNRNLETVSFDQESYPNIEFTDEFSPGDWSNTSKSQFLLPSCVSLSSLCSRGSSITPVPLQAIDDDTPKILRDSFVQPNKVIATSPNKKRVSPPRLRLNELGLSSLKSGRKFILKAIPSFPPLTPCIGSKDNTGQTSNLPPGDGTH
uniref:protein tesmin/TSO1-like CXC 2 n=1 Tax=Erigeron canadensis TaxID=72917 RepID=UPI001CB97132|nr:protein tesmin/TSO1-like CXC 2 [Erigeron canadensis]